MKVRELITEKKKELQPYIIRINGDTLFLKCLLFFGSILILGVIFFLLWVDNSHF